LVSADKYIHSFAISHCLGLLVLLSFDFDQQQMVNNNSRRVVKGLVHKVLDDILVSSDGRVAYTAVGRESWVVEVRCDDVVSKTDDESS
uniref:PPM-type phosphatase domain-containing protein n=1 Tax=Brugia timori TaxID=42155 RepID=A0A0R3QGB1_9BILA